MDTLLHKYIYTKIPKNRGRRGCGRMVVGFTTTYAATEIIKMQEFFSIFNVSGGHVFQQTVGFLMEVPNVLPLRT
jgi:hypothetical protein